MNKCINFIAKKNFVTGGLGSNGSNLVLHVGDCIVYFQNDGAAET